MRLFWRWLVKHEDSYATITGEIFGMTLRMEADTAIACTRCLVEEGFQSIEQLRGVYGMAWRCKRTSTKVALEAIARSVTAKADESDKMNSVLSMV